MNFKTCNAHANDHQAMLVAPTRTTVVHDGANRSKDVRHVKFESAKQVGQVVADVEQIGQRQSLVSVNTCGDAEPGGIGRQLPEATRLCC